MIKHKANRKLVQALAMLLIGAGLIMNIYLLLENIESKDTAEKNQYNIDMLFEGYLEKIDILSLTEEMSNEQKYYEQYYEEINYLRFAGDLVYKSSYSGYGSSSIIGIDNDAEHNDLFFMSVFRNVALNLAKSADNGEILDKAMGTRIQELISSIRLSLKNETECTEYIYELNELVK